MLSGDIYTRSYRVWCEFRVCAQYTLYNNKTKLYTCTKSARNVSLQLIRKEFLCQIFFPPKRTHTQIHASLHTEKSTSILFFAHTHHTSFLSDEQTIMPKVQKDPLLFQQFPDSVFAMVARRDSSKDHIQLGEYLDQASIACALQWMRENNSTTQTWCNGFGRREDFENLREVGNYLGLEGLVEDCESILQSSSLVFEPMGDFEFEIRDGALYIHFERLIARGIPKRFAVLVRRRARQTRLGACRTRNLARNGTCDIVLGLEQSMCVLVCESLPSAGPDSLHERFCQLFDKVLAQNKQSMVFCFELYQSLVTLFDSARYAVLPVELLLSSLESILARHSRVHTSQVRDSFESAFRECFTPEECFALLDPINCPRAPEYISRLCTGALLSIIKARGVFPENSYALDLYGIFQPRERLSASIIAQLYKQRGGLQKFLREK